MTAQIDRLIETGSGKVEFRLRVEGLKEQFVTSKDLADNMSLGEDYVAIPGLMRDGLSFEESPAIAYAEIEASGMTVQIVDRQSDDAVTTALAMQPQVTTWLISSIDTDDTTIQVLSNSGISAGDVVHIGTEAILVNDVATAGQLKNCTRAYRGTIAQSHYTKDEESLGYQEVMLDRFRVLESRRWYLYAHGEGDYTGELWTRGVCLTDAKLSEDHSTWQLSLDPITALLDADLGGDLDGEPKGPRGIYIPCSAAMKVTFGEMVSTRIVDAWDTTPGATTFYVAGFYESNTDLCKEITDQFAADIASYSGLEEIRAVAEGDYDWHIVVQTASSGERAPYLEIRSPTDGEASNTSLATPDGDPVVTVSASSSYVIRFRSGNRNVPRGFLGTDLSDRVPAGAELSDGTDITFGNFPSYRVYVGDHIALDSDLTAIELKFADSVTPDPVPVEIETVSVSEGYIDLRHSLELRRLGIGPGTAYTQDQPLEITYSRHYATGSLYDFMSALTTAAPTLANLGSVPFLTTSDVDLSDIQTVVGRRALTEFARAREYVSYDKVKLVDFLAEEAKLIGCYWRLNATGQLTLAPLRLAAPTEASTASLDDDAVLIDNGFPGWERGKDGTIAQVRIKTGYNAREDEHTGTEWLVRDQATYSRHKRKKELEIAPYSRYAGHIDPTAAEGVGREVLGVFGAPYAIVSVEVPFTMFDVLCGDTVALTCATLPDPTTGRRGITDQPAIVTSRRWDLDQGRGVFNLMVTFANIAGYAPSVRITSQSNVSGDQWDLTVATTDNVGNAVFASGDVLSDHFAAGFRVRGWEFDGANNPIAGEVDSVNDGTGVIRVTFDSTWTGSGEWWLGYDSGTSVVAAQEAYGFFGGTDGKVDFTSGTVDVGVYSP